MLSKRNRAGRHGWLAFVVVLAFCAAAGNRAAAQVRGISYTLTPVLEGVFFEKDAALKNAVMFGGRIGFGFGEFVELDGVYLFGNNVGTRLGELPGFEPATQELLGLLPGRDVEIHRFGGNVKFNIGRGSLFPFVALGSGVIRFLPGGMNNSESIYLDAGIGVQFSFRERYTIVAQAKNIAYRYNPGSTFMSEDDLTSVGLTSDDFGTVDVNSFTANVGVQFYLGGRSGGALSEIDRALQEQLRGGLRGLALRVEPVAAEIDFKESLGLHDNHRFVGLACGFDLGPLVGLRGFYWHGATADSWTEFDKIQAWGGELKFAFNDVGGGLIPYMTVGGGYMDVRNGYVGNGLAKAEDKPFAFGGVALSIPVGNAVGFDVGVRSLLMASGGIDNVSAPTSVEANTMIFGGVSFGLGRGARSAGGVFGREASASRAERRELSSGLSAQEQDLERAQARLDSLAAALSLQQRALEKQMMEQGMIRSTPPPLEGAPETSPTVEAAKPVAEVVREPRAGTRDRWMSLPIPEEGEVYLRFGGSGGVSLESTSGTPLAYLYDPATGTLTPLSSPEAGGPAVSGVEIAPEAPTAQRALPAERAPVPQEQTLTPEQIREIVRTVLVEERQQAVREQPGAPAPAAVETPQQKVEAQPAPVVTQESPQVMETAPVSEEVISVEAGAPGISQFALRPLVGYNIDRPHQGLLGVRAEFERVGRLYRLVSDFVVGFGGDKTTYNVNLNGTYQLGFGIEKRVYPYAGFGIGFLNIDDFELVLNLILGSDVRTRYGVFFLEYMNQDFDNNRLLGGYVVRF